MATITGTVTAVKRHGHTYYGNPMKSAYIENDEGGAWFRLSDNANLAYGIENPEYRDEVHEFHLTRAGRVSFARKAGQ